MSETRKLAAIMVADVAGYSRLAREDEDRILARLRTLRSDLIDPTVAVHHGRVVKRTGDGAIIEFRSVVEAVRCAIEIQNGMGERNSGLPESRRIEFRIGIHLGDVVEEGDGDLMGDGVNIAARLEGVARPGAICLSEDAYRQVKSRLDLKVSDLGPTQLRNFIDPIRIYALEVGHPILAGATHASYQESLLPPRLSIVVLPFSNLGGDASLDYFVDGVTESLTTDLSRISGAFVIARNTAFTFKGKAVDIKQLGRELNVRYVLEGSVQRGGSRMRVNVQLIDTLTGGHLWADRFDQRLADLCDMQDEIVARLANRLSAELITLEANRAERTSNPDATDFYFQGMAWNNKGWSRDYLLKAQEFYQRAIALDPSNVAAIVSSAVVDVVLVGNMMVGDNAGRLAAAEAAVTKVLAHAPDNAVAYRALGSIYLYTNRSEQTLAQYARALSLDPNYAAVHALVGFAKLIIGRADETAPHVEEALRLSPRDANAFSWYSYIAASKLLMGDDEGAVAWYRRSIDANRNTAFFRYLLAVALHYLGRKDEAQAELAVGVALAPAFTIKSYRAGLPPVNVPVALKQRERLLEGLRSIGVPEG
jgi:TolB-like protein/class 3 adenylate cyclase/Flp pilus assembly protein TadD